MDEGGLPTCADLFLPEDWGMGSLEQGPLLPFAFTSDGLEPGPALYWDSSLPPATSAASELTWPQPATSLPPPHPPTSLPPPFSPTQHPSDSGGGGSGAKSLKRSNSKKAAAMAAPGIAGGSSVGACRRGPTRQELRQQQQRQRAVEHQRIKELEQQLVALRQQMQVGAGLRHWWREAQAK